MTANQIFDNLLKKGVTPGLVNHHYALINTQQNYYIPYPKGWRQKLRPDDTIGKLIKKNSLTKKTFELIPKNEFTAEKDWLKDFCERVLNENVAL